jgi:hypothetical protein
MRRSLIATGLFVASCSPSGFYLTCKDMSGDPPKISTYWIKESISQVAVQHADGNFVNVCDDCGPLVSPTTIQWSEETAGRDGTVFKHSTTIDRKTGRLISYTTAENALRIGGKNYPYVHRDDNLVCERSSSPPETQF